MSVGILIFGVLVLGWGTALTLFAPLSILFFSIVKSKKRNSCWVTAVYWGVILVSAGLAIACIVGSSWIALHFGKMIFEKPAGLF